LKFGYYRVLFIAELRFHIRLTLHAKHLRISCSGKCTMQSRYLPGFSSSLEKFRGVWLDRVRLRGYDL